ncbi:hypothetical protein [Paenibacillus sp. GP183]|jgi:hypothetical protein|uniref:hypothetical protein n=1 Tax=Paenibacillus sp. GP183 TaxID=1882751 RepID=UPI0008964FBD|nr:hypothetical protein [Paenibacillus sp. GP183]SED10509.1 hypothetical protein SAMN05443246_5726 [Paenibacillus sp. GP183]
MRHALKTNYGIIDSRSQKEIIEHRREKREQLIKQVRDQVHKKVEQAKALV